MICMWKKISCKRHTSRGRCIQHTEGIGLISEFTARYFTIAHEIAHNLVQPHNSEHEFYFSAICERYLLQLAKLIGSPLSIAH